MKRALLVATLAGLLPAAPAAFAQIDGATAPAAAPATAPVQTAKTGKRDGRMGDPNRQVCRTQAATGSRLGAKKICKTAREWEEQRLGAKDELDRHQRPDGTNGF